MISFVMMHASSLSSTLFPDEDELIEGKDDEFVCNWYRIHRNMVTNIMKNTRIHKLSESCCDIKSNAVMALCN